MKLTHLFSPIRIGNLDLPNRILFSAVTTYYDYHYDLKGEERSAYFYAERARGGAAMLVIGALQALYPGRRDPPRVAINSDRFIPQLRVWTKAVHDAGSKAAAQLAIWNYWAKGGEGTPAEDVSPSGVVTSDGSYPHAFKKVMFDPTSRPLTVEEIRLIEEQVAQAAERAVEAGFDAIEIPAVSLNLASRFITPYTNRRTDEYGGNWENNTRFLVETIAGVKKRVGPGFPIIVRIPGTDMMPWGINLEESKQIVPYIARAGVHCLSIMPGGYETREPRQQMSVPRGTFVYLAEGIKQVVDMPVCTNMRISDPAMADRIIAEGRADLVAMCRPLVADPELPNKAREGRLEDIRLCVACCTCFEDIAVNGPMGCSVNAAVGREEQCRVARAARPKQVLVIGGGPGGMEAARVAALRGHGVTLWEKSDRLGGELLQGVLPPRKQEWTSLIDYLTVQMRRLKVDVRLNTKATVDTVLKAGADAVIVATGAVAVAPRIPGIGGPNVAMAADVLAGRPMLGDSAVVIGGGLIGCETAEFLAERGQKVTILEMLPRMADDVGMFNRWVLLDRLASAGVRMEAEVKSIAITADGVRSERAGKAVFFPGSLVVIAVGMKADDALGKALTGRVRWLRMIGACVQPRRVKQAIAEGFQAGLEV